MKKLLLAFYLLISFASYGEYSTTVGNLTIEMQDGNDDWIKFYKDGKLILEEKCTMMCEIHIIKSKSFNFKFEDGLVVTDGREALNLHPDNIKVFKTGWFDQNEVIGFVVSTTNATGKYGSQTLYTVDIDSGEVSSQHNEFDAYLNY